MTTNINRTTPIGTDGNVFFYGGAGIGRIHCPSLSRCANQPHYWQAAQTVCC